MKDAAQIIIDRPGLMRKGSRGHREFVAWLEDLAKRLRDKPEQFVDSAQFKSIYSFTPGNH